jgi:hypothetical protein
MTNKTEQKPGQTDNYAYIADEAYRVEDSGASLSACETDREGNDK